MLWEYSESQYLRGPPFGTRSRTTFLGFLRWPCLSVKNRPVFVSRYRSVVFELPLFLATSFYSHRRRSHGSDHLISTSALCGEPSRRRRGKLFGVSAARLRNSLTDNIFRFSLLSLPVGQKVTCFCVSVSKGRFSPTAFLSHSLVFPLKLDNYKSHRAPKPYARFTFSQILYRM